MKLTKLQLKKNSLDALTDVVETVEEIRDNFISNHALTVEDLAMKWDVDINTYRLTDYEDTQLRINNVKVNTYNSIISLLSNVDTYLLEDEEK